MAQKSFNSMNKMPSHGNASNAKVGNAREGYTHGKMGENYGHVKENMQHPGNHASNEYQCSFPHPPPRRTYCHPAPFSSVNGSTYFRLVDAYGSSVPSSR
jgi:hypothetical protein